jgi:hypothetical protein
MANEPWNEVAYKFFSGGTTIPTSGGGTGATSTKVQGADAAGAAITGNPVLDGGKTTAANPTYVADTVNPLSLTTAGGLRTAVFSAGGQPVSADIPNADNIGAGTYAGLVVMSFPYVFDGVNFDRARGDSANGTMVQGAGTEYETVAASVTDQILGATGAVGDLFVTLIIVPATVSPGAVSITDGNGAAITVFAGGATSVTDLKPIVVPLNLKSVNSTTPGWKVTTGSNVSAIGIGNFT